MINDKLLDMPFDQYQRYKTAAEIVKTIKNEAGRKKLRILDVGGYFKNIEGQDTFPLQEFLPEDKVIVFRHSGLSFWLIMFTETH